MAYDAGAGCTGNTIYAFYLSGNHYMTTPGNCDDLVTPFCDGTTDTLMKTWGTYGITTSATSSTDGAANTTILAGYSGTDAARYCQNMVYGGYSDWFLPARDQLAKMYLNRGSIG